ncbi:MAG: hypothetical protein APR63_01915 [Desulfuromonas sp. SDB]|nr:MAG: hypothetical protein APR63_01915 [Desulfuromonas sp. SDB]
MNNIIKTTPKLGYDRYLIKTDLVTEKNTVEEVVSKYGGSFIENGDILVLAESVVAISQGRAIPVDKIKISVLAKILWRFVTRNPSGIGLRSPTSMQCAIDESGGLRIVIAAIFGGITKLFGKSGIFYRIAGMQAATIDAAFTSPVEPYDKCVIKGPKNPNKVASDIAARFNIQAAVMDINDIGGSWVLGASNDVDRELLSRIMLDNPMGQGKQMTPLCLLRKKRT